MITQTILKKPAITVKKILKSFWSVYKSLHEEDIKDYQIKEVEKSLNCYSDSDQNGCFMYYCKKCDIYVFKFFGCNSRLCSSCGKRYADQWSRSLAKSMFNVPHRHIVFSVPSDLWNFLKDKSQWKDYMDCARDCFNNCFNEMLKKKLRITSDLQIGMICVFHPFGKDMKYYPHLHLIITEGGFDKKGKFHKINFFPANVFRKSWMYYVLKRFQEIGLPNTITTKMYEKYPKGFYIWVHKAGRINNPKLIVRYLGRYVRHPAIANRRITFFDGDNVKFYYDNKGEIVTVEMNVEEFITALIQHIPPPNFKMIRYYLGYSRKAKKLINHDTYSDIKQCVLTEFGMINKISCPKCKGDMIFIAYLPKPPPPDRSKITTWLD